MDLPGLDQPREFAAASSRNLYGSVQCEHLVVPAALGAIGHMQFARRAMDEKNGMTFGLYQNLLGVWRHYLVYIHTDWNTPMA